MKNRAEKGCFRMEFMGDEAKKAKLVTKWESVKRHMQHVSHDRLFNFDILFTLLTFYLEKFRDLRKSV